MRSTAVFVGLFLVLSIIVALVMARGIAAPLKDLARMARGLARGNLDSTISVAARTRWASSPSHLP